MKRMFTVSVMLVCCLVLFGSPSHAQKRTTVKPTAQPEAKEDQSKPPMLPIEVNIGYHRNEPAILLTVKNLDQKRLIRSIGLMLVVVDPVKVKAITQFRSSDFSFGLPVMPGESGITALTKSDDMTVDWENRQTGRCLNYKSGNWPGLQKPFVFAPTTCTGDMLVVRVLGVTFTDGSKWTAPKVEGDAR